MAGRSTCLSALPHDLPFQWIVGSASRLNVDHIVDLSNHSGNGDCSCEFFSYRCRPLIRSGSPSSDATRCKHIEAARRAFADMMITHLIDEQLHPSDAD